jgi:nicotinate-nucleotide pyrophosphorylase (carboxylating)
MADVTPPALEDYVLADELADLIRRAREEDLGPDGIDVTSALFIPADLTAKASVVARKPGYLSGAALLNHVVNAYDAHISVKVLTPDGSPIKTGQAVATLTGPLRSILTAERVALNFMTMLSGVATLTARYVEQTAGTRAKVYDTRKTLPGLRGLQKYAVACGGGATHRMGLYDAVLLKDNHLAHVDAGNLTGAVTEAVQKCRAAHPGLKFVMIEVDTLAQLQQVLTTGIDIVLLDNMTTDQLTQAVEMRNSILPGVELEASGCVTLDTIRGIAQTGVDRISVGALTHSAQALDLGLDISR